MDKTLLIMAAGMGSRYGGNKQIDGMGPNNEALMLYSIHDAIKAGFTKVVFIIKHDFEERFRTQIGDLVKDQIKVEYAFQELTEEQAACLPSDRVKPLGTTHALLCARPYIQGNFAILNADDYYGVEAFRLAAEYLNSANKDEDNHFCMVGYGLAATLTENGTVSRGICTATEDGFLSSIVERTKIRTCGKDAEVLIDDEWKFLSGDSIASMNFFGFTERIFEYAEKELDRFLHDPATDLMKGECYLPTVAGVSIKDGECDLKVLVTPDNWFGVTYQEDRPVVVENIKKLTEAGVYPAAGLWK